MTAWKARKEIIAWCFYDFANSAFFTIITTFIFATYFTQKIALNATVGTRQWGMAIGMAGLFIAVLSPIFGAIADHYGRRKPWLFCLTYIAVAACALLWFAQPNSHSVTLSLLLVVIATITVETGMVFYNAFLPELAPEDYTGRISGWAWSTGYLGGLLALSVALAIILPTEKFHWSGPLTALWLGVFALPLFFSLTDTPRTGQSLPQSIQQGLRSLGHTLKKLYMHPALVLFLIARMLYTDGLNTVFSFGGIYAAGSFGMSLDHVIIFGIAMNVTAGIGAAGFASLDDGLGSKPTILISLICMIVLTTVLLIIHSLLLFWVFALLLGLFVGPIQAASRSLMSHMTQPQHRSEFFGLYAFSGKATAFLGPWLVAAIIEVTSSQRLGLASVLLFFVAGTIILYQVKVQQNA